MIYLFDIDGTLTQPRQKISDEFEEFFYNWMKDKKVYLVTGSDLPKVHEQLSKRIIYKCSGIFASMANELYFGDSLIYENHLNIPSQLIGWLFQQREFSEYPFRADVPLEYRKGMLNFSVLGRLALNNERDKYEEWDKVNGERKRIVNYINQKYPELEACIGGQISVDIQTKGKNKSQASKWIRENSNENIAFFGDKCFRGGNDYAIFNDVNSDVNGNAIQINSVGHLKNILIRL